MGHKLTRKQARKASKSRKQARPRYMCMYMHARTRHACHVRLPAPADSASMTEFDSNSPSPSPTLPVPTMTSSRRVRLQFPAVLPMLTLFSRARLHFYSANTRLDQESTRGQFKTCKLQICAYTPANLCVYSCECAFVLVHIQPASQ